MERSRRERREEHASEEVIRRKQDRERCSVGWRKDCNVKQRSGSGLRQEVNSVNTEGEVVCG